MAEIKGLSLRQLFQKLGAIIKSFAKDIEDVVESSEAKAPTEEIKRIISEISSRSSTDPKEKEENKEILNALNELLKDKRIFNIMSMETEEWLELVDAIEKRIEMNKDLLDKDELRTIDNIHELTNEIRNTLRKEREEKDGL